MKIKPEDNINGNIKKKNQNLRVFALLQEIICECLK